MARLKKLNLKNYAAPRGYSYPNIQGNNGRQPSFSMSAGGIPASPPGLTPPVLTLTSASPTARSFVTPPASPPNLTVNTANLEMSSPTLSTTSSRATSATSAESTPVQTPVQDNDSDDHDDKKGWKADVDAKEKEILTWSLSMEHGHFATTLLPSESTVPSSSSPTIPISIPGGETGQRGGYPYTSYPYPGNTAAAAAAVPTEMASSPPFSDLGRSEHMKRGVYWDWGSAAANVALRGEESKVDDSWLNHQSSRSSGVLNPPQRRRHSQQSRASASSSSTSSSSGSGSDSNKSSKPAAAVPFPRVSSPLISSSSSTPTPSSPVPPKTSSPVPLKLNLPTRSFNSPPPPPPAAAGDDDNVVVQSPYPRRGLRSQPPPPPQQQQRKYGGRHYPLPLPSPPVGMEGAAAASSDDIYQALVREWCFAQGPGPVVVGSVGMSGLASSSSGQTTPVFLPRLASPLSEGE